MRENMFIEISTLIILPETTTPNCMKLKQILEVLKIDNEQFTKIYLSRKSKE